VSDQSTVSDEPYGRGTSYFPDSIRQALKDVHGVHTGLLPFITSRAEAILANDEAGWASDLLRLDGITDQDEEEYDILPQKVNSTGPHHCLHDETGSELWDSMKSMVILTRAFNNELNFICEGSDMTRLMTMTNTPAFETFEKTTKDVTEFLQVYRNVEFKYGAQKYVIDGTNAGRLLSGGDAKLCE
jgi:hypothetical protein